MWKTTNEAVHVLNAQLGEAGHDLTKRKPGNDVYGKPSRQRLENLAFTMLPIDPKKRARNDLRLFADHVSWLNEASRDKDTGWPTRYERHENLATDLSISKKAVGEATKELVDGELLVTSKKCPPGKSTPQGHYRLSEGAHIVLALLAEAGAMALPPHQWRDLLSPASAKDKPLRDVLAGWQSVDTSEALAAMRTAIREAVDRVNGDGVKVDPRAFHQAWAKAFKEAVGYAPEPYGGKEAGQSKTILAKLKAMSKEPDAGFTFGKDMALAFAADLVKRWGEFAAEAKDAKGFKKVPGNPDLGFLVQHMALALKVHLAPVLPSGKSGW